MNMVDAVLQALARTPEKDRVFWADMQRRQYDQWWQYEDHIAILERLGADDEASADLIARARAGQVLIQQWQRDVA